VPKRKSALEKIKGQEPISNGDAFFPVAHLQDTLASGLRQAKRSGMDAAEVVVSEESGFSVTARSGDVETLEHHQEKSFVVTVYQDQRLGTASTTDLSPDALSVTVEKACAFARYAGQDKYSGLADPELLSHDYPDLALFHHWDISPEKAIEMAIHCEQVARDQDSRITQSEGSTVNTYDSFHFYGNSNDFIGGYPVSHHTISCGVIAGSGQEMQRDYEYTVARSHEDLDDVVLVAKRAAEKTLLKLDAQKITTRRCPVIFHVPAAKSLLRAFTSAISGGNLYRKTSFLLDHIDKKIFPDHVHIHQQPHMLRGMGSAPFDAEGVRTEDRDYVKEGVLTSYLLGSYSARKLGLQSTGNAGGIHNLFISHSEHNLKKLFEEMGTGLFVTELIGQGVNILTGDYSRGAAGFWIENGAIKHAVHEVTIAGNLKDMFKNIIAIANDIDHRSNIHTGSIWLQEMTVAGA